MDIKTLQVGPIGTNCYILCDEAKQRCAVIDPGGDAGRVAAAVEESGCVPCAILLTHGHYDHTGAVAELSAQLAPLAHVVLETGREVGTEMMIIAHYEATHAQLLV